MCLCPAAQVTRASSELWSTLEFGRTAAFLLKISGISITYISIYLSIYLSMYIYIHKYMHIYMCIYIYIYIYISRLWTNLASTFQSRPCREAVELCGVSADRPRARACMFVCSEHCVGPF